MNFDRGTALSSIRKAMLGMVSPNLRGICIEEKNAHPYICFYYENTPSAEEERMVHFMCTEFISNFPDQETDFKIFTLPREKMIPKEGLAIYLRYGELGPV